MGGYSIQMPKFFVNKADIRDGKVYISGEDCIHIKKVLRLRCGENIIVSDGSGYDYEAVIDEIEPQKVVANVARAIPNHSEPPVEVTLFQGIPKSDKMDFIIQKCVELGVKSIVPVITERTVVKIDSSKESEKKTIRWQKIALEAAKQSNRGIIPDVSMPLPFKQALDSLKGYDLKLIPYEKESQNQLKTYLGDRRTKKVALFIGPEGGFSVEETLKAADAGVVTVTLGPRILRTETAGIMVLSILMYTLGDM